MKILAKKMSSLGLLKLEMALGTATMAAAVIILPASIAWIDYTLLLNPYVLGVIFLGMLLFASVAYFLFIRPYFIYRSMPEVLVETDGEFLYIHAKKEAKIPLSDIELATVYVDLPFIYQKEFITEIIIHLFSEEYGTVTLELPGHGNFKMRFVSNAEETGDSLIGFFKDLWKNEGE